MIEIAKPCDIPELAGLLEILFSQETEFFPDPQRQAASLSFIIENPDSGTILVFREKSGVAGMVNLLYTVSTARGGRVAILEDMVVRPGARGRGIGSQLLKAAIDKARSSGCSRITLLTDSDNHDAMRFYSRHGFSRSQMIVMRLLNEE